MAEVFGFDDVVRNWPRFPVEADKYARGVVGIMTGSDRYPGAALLSVLGALNSGAGFVRFCGTNSARMAILTRTPSVTFGLGRVGAWVLGCGWDDEDIDSNREQWNQAMASHVPVVVDAGGLAFVKEGCSTSALLTPHAGELARLLEVERADVEAAPQFHVMKAARTTGAAVLLKGHTQYLGSPSGKVTQIQHGSPWLARAGSGDVLAGIAGTLLAQTGDPELAGLLAAGLQAWVSTIHLGPYPPNVMAEYLPGHIGSQLPTR
ncbi:MAG: NAD(P)H-hydrate dehydratase [Propionibacteriaceae bacterium]|jgi:hydroxyethylthiazole kinase-like uncharacterized protein yjeF|nr:NAD(P)H-hydrate dehydratase [Propionibacteriaceae bacterium]